MAKAKAVIGTQKSDAKKNGVTVPKSPYNKLVTAIVNKPDIKKGITRIDDLLKGQTHAGISLGKQFICLHEDFERHVKAESKNGHSEATPGEAFYSFVEIRFGLKERRVQEYIRVAKNPLLSNLNVPISSLVEIARLEDEQLKHFFKDVKGKALSGMTFRQVKGIVQKYKPESAKKKETEVSKDKAQPQASAVSENIPTNVVGLKRDEDKSIEVKPNFNLAIAELRMAFEDLKTRLPETEVISDRGWMMLDSLLGEIADWTEHRKLAQKKVA